MEKERKIYKYNDGFVDIYADPGDLDYRLTKASESEDLPTLDKWLNIPEGEGKVDDKQMELFMEACHRLDPIVRQAFEIRPFDRKTGEGMLHEEVLDLYFSYVEWRMDLKKNTD